MLSRLERYLPFALPRPHFMCLAPLDAWVRMLFFPFAWCPPRYWLRLAVCWYVSFLSTCATLPERLLMWLVWRGSGAPHERFPHKPGVVVILGYFRTGTTHLHYLLSCDRAFVTPRWYHALVPQGFVVSWFLLRLLQVPFVSGRRPMDDMSFGPSWPAEDDFACNNMAAASSLPGRFVIPARRDHDRRYHNLEGLTAGELSRWRRAMSAFLWKLTLLSRRRRLLLKSPSHTARVSELLEFFGPENVKFVHISRSPRSVVESNLKMYDRMRRYALQPSPGVGELRRDLTGEYIASEQSYLDASRFVPPGSLSEMRFEDLSADPLGELRRAYRELDMSWTEDTEARVTAYLASVEQYKPATHEKPDAAPETDEHRAGLTQVAERFGHNRPAKPKVSLAVPETLRDRLTPHSLRACAAGAAAVLPLAALWMLASWADGNRLSGASFVVALTLGKAMLLAGRVGSVRIGLVAAVLAAITITLGNLGVSFMRDWGRSDGPQDIATLLYWTRDEMVKTPHCVWALMGVLGAYRLGSRTHLLPGSIRAPLSPQSSAKIAESEPRLPATGALTTVSSSRS